jgi:hypothetical protein
MKTKFYLSLVAMVFAALTASAAETPDFWYNFNNNNLAYKITDASLATVRVVRPTNTGYSDLGGVLTIPEVVYNNNKSYTVTAIGDLAFDGCQAITSVVIPKTVKLIGRQGFYNCMALKTVTFQNASQSALETIEASAFLYNPELTSINLPQSIKTIKSSVFKGCSKLTSVTLPNGLTTLGEYVFEGCSSLRSINIPTKIQVLEREVFAACKSLTSITIPSNIKSISFRVFRDCTGLTSVTIPSTVSERLLNYYGNWFEGCTGLTSVNIQNSFITSGEFYGCTNLKTVNIGSNMTFVSDSLVYYSPVPFKDCPIETLNVGSNAAANIAYYPNAKSTLKTLNLTNGVTDLPESAFEGCSALTTVTLPSTLDGMGNSAFSGCTKMRELTAKMQRPFAIDASVFSGVQQHGYCDLHVPQGSSGRYKAMEVWKEFYVIDEGAGPSNIRGDVNNDGDVTIADVVAVLNIMAGN